MDPISVQYHIVGENHENVRNVEKYDVLKNS